MRWASLLLFMSLLAFGYATWDNLTLAEQCDEEECQLPECRCSNLEIPGGLSPRDTPQFVLLTFDDAVTELNTQTYRSLIYRRTNKLNQCPIGVSFYVSHEYTDYVMVNELYNQGFEIALHSISHRTPQTWWRDASYDDLLRDIGDQRGQIAHFANIPPNTIQGVRTPFLQLSGNNTFKMMMTAALKYDISWPTIRFMEDGLWPYTLHYRSIQDCVVPPCPTASLPGPWVIPMIAWVDLQGFPCSMADACFAPPDTEEGWFQFILRNFERHYLGNRAPFGVYIHEAYLRGRPYVREALRRFLDMVNNINDVFMVNAKDVIEWVEKPVPINEYVKQDCKRTIPAACRATFCPSLFSQDTLKTYYLRVCNRCPRTYPWVNNPLGV